MSRLANSVAIATTDGVAGRAGTTVSTLSPVSAEEPPSLLICLHWETAVARNISANKTFAVNMLAEGQRQIAQIFAGNLPLQGQDKFDHTPHLWHKTRDGAWQLQGALVFFGCRVIRSVRYQSHIVVIGRVLDIVMGDEEAQPLLYANRSYTMLSSLPPDSDPKATTE